MVDFHSNRLVISEEVNENNNESINTSINETSAVSSSDASTTISTTTDSTVNSEDLVDEIQLRCGFLLSRTSALQLQNRQCPRCNQKVSSRILRLLGL